MRSCFLPRCPSIERFGCLAPDSYHEVAEDHSPEMCRMCYVAPRSSHCQVKLNSTVNEHEVFCLYGNRREEKHQLCVWEEHTECKQNAEDCSRSPYGGNIQDQV